MGEGLLYITLKSRELEMENVGHRWLETIGMLDAHDSAKLCALAALDMRITSSVGADTYLDIWEGNIYASEDIGRTLRRAIHHGATSSQELLSAVGISTEALSQFLKEEDHCEPEASTRAG